MTHTDAPLTVDPDGRRDSTSTRPERSEEVCRRPPACTRRSDVQAPLEALEALGHVEETDDGAYAA